MKTYFQQRLEYDNWANSIVFDLVQNTAFRNERIAVILNHIFEAQRLWLARIQKEEYHARIFTTAPLEEVQKLKEETYHLWKVYIADLRETDFEELYTYKNIKGDAYANTLTDILTHVFNHAAHHRAEIITLLRVEHPNLSIPPTDYIFYLR